ncbi:MAG: 3'(2'),5'-bisphosphate nucleotidase [Trueperaceae bacterium]|nr:MAG: 3'(2'),5'-bisphosphate nucleotidase [Trueperaceae bacterium]
MSPHPSLATLLPHVVAVARAAGRAIMEIYRTDFDVRFKDDTSPLTKADLAAHRVIADGLRALTPELPLVSEEQVHAPFDTRRAWPRHWLVDPLDGTREFVARSGEFSVNIALVEAGRPHLGVVHAPVTDVTYAGGTGLGAWRSLGDGSAEPIGVRRPEGAELVVLTSRTHRDERTEAFLAELAKRHRLDVQQRGSALKACLIAAGEAHLYPRMGRTWEWDTAASQAVLEAAGGVLCEVGGAVALRYGKRDLLNPAFYAAYGSDAPHP